MAKVLVIGDSCQDIFRYGTCDRLCPEAPVPVLKPTRTIGSGGMAINVMENLKALGIDTDIITNDLRPVKTRYVDEVSNQILIRVDENDKIEEMDADRFNKTNFGMYDAIVISDYDKGFLTEDMISMITEFNPLVFMDTKKKIGRWAEDVKIIKINEKEFHDNDAWVVNEYKGELVVTLGQKGAKHWFNEPQKIEKEHEVRDLSGAGDTFLAGLVADYIKNKDIRSAITYANKCASWVVSQKGVAIVNPELI